MIQKIIKGKSFKGVIGYVSEKKDAVFFGGSTYSPDAAGTLKEFVIQSSRNPELSKPVAHICLSLSPEDKGKLSKDDFDQLLWEYMDEMGYDQFCAWQHNDTDLEHYHVIANRVGFDEKTVSDSWDYKRGEKILQNLRSKYGLTEVAASWEVDRKAAKSGEMGLWERTGQVSNKEQLKDLIDDLTQDKPKMTELIERLQVNNVQVLPNIQKTGRVAGLSFEINGMAFKASDLGKAYSFGGLQKKKGVVYNGEEKEVQILREAAELAEISRAGNQPDQEIGRDFKNVEGVGANQRFGPELTRDFGENRISIGGDFQQANSLNERLGGDQNEIFPNDDQKREAEQSDFGRHQQRSLQSQESSRRVDKNSQRNVGTSRILERDRKAEGLENSLRSIVDSSDNSRNLDRLNSLLPKSGQDKVGTDERRLQKAGRGDNLQLLATTGSTSEKAIAKQIEAFQKAGVHNFEIGIMKPKGTDRKGKGNRSWNSQEIVKNLPFLMGANTSGLDIYIKPDNRENHQGLILLDDIKKETLDQIRADGFQICNSVETSKDNFQAWVRVEKNLDKDLATEIGRKLAEKYKADPASVDWRHFGRMAGFTNQKPEHKKADGYQPFCRLNDAKRTPEKLSKKAQDFVDAIKIERQNDRKIERQNASDQEWQKDRLEKRAFYSGKNEHFGSDEAAFHSFANRVGGNDVSRQDWGAICEMFKRGADEEKLVDCLIKYSPDINFRKGKHAKDYARRSVRNAMTDPKVLEAKTRFENTEHEYTKISGAAPSYKRK